MLQPQTQALQFSQHRQKPGLRPSSSLINPLPLMVAFMKMTPWDPAPLLGRGQHRLFSVVLISGGSCPHLPWELSGAPLLVPKKIPGDTAALSPPPLSQS